MSTNIFEVKQRHLAPRLHPLSPPPPLNSLTTFPIAPVESKDLQLTTKTEATSQTLVLTAEQARQLVAGQTFAGPEFVAHSHRWYVRIVPTRTKSKVEDKVEDSSIIHLHYTDPIYDSDNANPRLKFSITILEKRQEFEHVFTAFDDSIDCCEFVLKPEGMEICVDLGGPENFVMVNEEAAMIYGNETGRNNFLP